MLFHPASQSDVVLIYSQQPRYITKKKKKKEALYCNRNLRHQGPKIPEHTPFVKISSFFVFFDEFNAAFSN